MVVAGIDVSKALLDVSVADGPVHRFANSGPGLLEMPADTGPSACPGAHGPIQSDGR